MATPYNNKKAYDPGRLRHKVKFKKQTSAPDGYGGTTVTEVIVLETFAGKEKVNQFNQMAIQAGATLFNKAMYLIIRNRKDFYPNKDMQIEFNGESYTLLGEPQELDDPVTYLQLLCVLSK